MVYKISFASSLSHLIEIKATIRSTSESVVLCIPEWRPGRYEAANYSKNIIGLSVRDVNGNELSLERVSHSQWKVDTSQIDEITVEYSYYAYQMDAGNSWYGDGLIYINFINCLVYAKGKENESCDLKIDIPNNYQVGCSLAGGNGSYRAKDYYELVDSPLLASNKLTHLKYKIGEVPFHIWIHGSFEIDESKLVADFKKFSQNQMDTLGTFPESSYHFLLLIRPNKIYHGVEHGASTVICLGPENELNTDKLYSSLMGVSSHELFHAWNIIKIRPKELLPYEFNKQVNFPTGFVAEGFTTYYGDLFLVRSGVFDIEWYFDELNLLFKRHCWNYGRFNESVIESSLGLWADGYQPSAPGKMSSIYVEGALSALMLDLLIRKTSHHQFSLDDVVRDLWKEFGQRSVGYTTEDIRTLCEKYAQVNLAEFFNNYISGTVDKFELSDELLGEVGCTLQTRAPEDFLAEKLGVVLAEEKDEFRVKLIEPKSIAQKYFSQDDVVLNIDDQPLNSELLTDLKESDFKFLVMRDHQEISIEIPASSKSHLNFWTINKNVEPTQEQKDAFKKWLGVKFD